MRIFKDFYALVDKDVMYKKIGHTVQRNPHTNVKIDIEAISTTKIHEKNGRNGKNNKEIIVFFQRRIAAVIVMVPVQRPQEAMHNVLVNEPGKAFHHKKCYEYD